MDLVKSVYELRQKFMIIGLTGRTGSGCTTIANFLKNDFEDLFSPTPSVSHEGITNNERKYKIEYNFLKSIWEQEKFQFQVIKASDIIFYYVIKEGFDVFTDTLQDAIYEKAGQAESNVFTKKLDNEKRNFNNRTKKVNRIDRYLTSNNRKKLSPEKKPDFEKAKEYLGFIKNDLPQFRRQLMERISDLTGKKTTSLFQYWGNNLRQYGSISKKGEKEANNPSKLAETMNYIIKLILEISEIEKKSTFILIDSLRNPYEVYYFREQYSAFYLMSINTNEAQRMQNLMVANFRKDEIEKLDEMEYPSKRKDIEHSYFSQDVEKCVELSDIHVAHNNQPIKRNSDLKCQLIHFISLILHPGLVQPTHEERLMQIAYTAKLNSGCISRQVGAVVTDKNYSVKAIGWNTVAKGQTPCSLRSLEDIYKQNDLSAFSEFEKNDEDFRTKVKMYYEQYHPKDNPPLQGIPLAFCFKDYYTSIVGEKNQVHTRSLHAEENAFLQLAKYGFVGIDEGFLFTTASPCELCAKKAYQLGITKVFYIDIYPGISEAQIFQAGDREVEMIQFKGAIGRAYEALYTPFFPLKDEIEYLSEVKISCSENKSSMVKTEENKESIIKK